MKSIWLILIVATTVVGFLPVFRFRKTPFFVFFVACALLDPFIVFITFMFHMHTYLFLPFITVVTLLALPIKSKKNIYISLISAFILIPVFKDYNWIPLFISVINSCYIIFFLWEMIIEQYRLTSSVSLFLFVILSDSIIDAVKVYLYYRYLDLFSQLYTLFLILGLLSPFVISYFGFSKKYFFKRNKKTPSEDEVIAEEFNSLEVDADIKLKLVSILNKRELEVLLHLAEGEKQNEIARKLYIDRRTVYFHVRNIKRKLNISSLIELYRLAHQFKEEFSPSVKPTANPKIND